MNWKIYMDNKETHEKRSNTFAIREMQIWTKNKIELHTY
jgi:hypothetical protein